MDVILVFCVWLFSSFTSRSVTEAEHASGSERSGYYAAALITSLLLIGSMIWLIIRIA